MINWDREEFIREIERKLSSRVPLSCLEIKTVIAALRESKQCYQEPYFEVVYHDEYGKCQSRIMNPEYQSKTKEMPGSDVCIVSERFSIDFNRLVREKGLE